MYILTYILCNIQIIHTFHTYILYIHTYIHTIYTNIHTYIHSHIHTYYTYYIHTYIYTFIYTYIQDFESSPSSLPGRRSTRAATAVGAGSTSTRPDLSARTARQVPNLTYSSISSGSFVSSTTSVMFVLFRYLYGCVACVCMYGK